MKKIIIPLLMPATFLVAGFNAQAATCDAVEVTASALNVRTGPSTSNTKVGTVQYGEQYVKTDESGNWAEVWYDGEKRWLSAASYTTPVTVNCGRVTAGALNVRSGAGSSYSIVGTVPLDSQWVMLGSSSSGSWEQIYFDSEKRWAYGSYLDTSETPAPPPPISVTDFVINNGDTSTESQFVNVTFTINGSTATQFMMSEYADFSDADWVDFNSNPGFSVTAGDGTKTLYYRAKNAEGRVSDTVSDSIELVTPIVSPNRTIDDAAWFAEYRNQFGSLSQGQVDGINFIIPNMEKDTEAAYTNVTVFERQMAYLWATMKLEVANTYKPITEYGTQYCANYDGGCTYKGRGYVQLTHKYNYRNMTPHVNRILGLNIDLVANPTLALDPDIAYTVMSYGSFNGVFTGKAIGDYINANGTDYYNARRVINGTNKASLVAGYAAKFQKVMEAATN